MKWIHKEIGPPLRLATEPVWSCSAWGLRDDGQYLYRTLTLPSREAKAGALAAMVVAVGEELDTYLYEGCHCKVMWRKSNRYKSRSNSDGKRSFSIVCTYHNAA